MYTNEVEAREKYKLPETKILTTTYTYLMTSNRAYTYQEILYYDWHAQAENDINNIAYPRIWKRLILENCMRIFHLSKYQHKRCK